MKKLPFIKRKESGQSLVEMALMLPILLIVLAGMVEVSYWLVTQNRVSNASRAGTGFASGNISNWDNPDEWSEAIGLVATNSVRETMDLDPDLWDLWTIKAKLNAAGTDFVEWEAVHVDALGNHQVITSADWSGTEEAATKAKILTQLQAGGTTAADLELVATATFYKGESLIGFPAIMQPERIESINVMRMDEPAPYQGCDAFPVAVNFDSYSLYPPGAALPAGSDYENYPVGGWSHWAGKSEGEPVPAYTDFPRNVPGIRLMNGRPGYIYKVKDDSDSNGNFNWLSWDGCQSATCVRASLQYPGNALSFDGPGDLSGNNQIDRYDLVQGASGNMASAWDIVLDELMAQTGRTIKLLVFTPSDVSGGDANADGFRTGSGGDSGLPDVNGGSDWFEVYGYIVTRIWGGNKSQGGPNGGFLMVEYIDWANDCGGLGER